MLWRFSIGVVSCVVWRAFDACGKAEGTVDSAVVRELELRVLCAAEEFVP